MFKTLKSKIILVVLVSIIFFGTLATFFVYFYTKDAVIKDQEGELTVFTKNIASEVDYIFNLVISDVKKISENKKVIDFLEKQEEKKDYQNQEILDLLEAYKITDSFLAIYILDKEGEAIVSTDESFLEKDFSFRRYFQKPMQGGGFCSDSAVGVISGELGYYFSFAILNEKGEPIGITAIKLAPDLISQVIADNFSGDRHYMFVDEYGVVLHSDIDFRIFKSLGDLSQEQLNEIKDSKRFTGLDITSLKYDTVLDKIYNYKGLDVFEEKITGKKYLSLVKLSNTPFYLILEQDYDLLTEFATKLSLSLSLFVILAAISALILIIIFLNSFLKPFEKFKKIAEKVSEGDFSYRLKEKGGQEIKSLAITFNQMIDNIVKLRKDVDEKVIEQTKEIEDKNKDLEEQQSAMLNILEDIDEEKLKTELAAKELEKFKLAVDNASDHIVITDAEGIILYTNKAVEKITGFSPKEIIGKKVGTKENWGGLMSKEVYEKLWKTIKIKKDNFIGELKNRRKDGEGYDVKASISPVLDKEGKVKFFVGIERDISKEKAIDRTKTEFVSLASHQLRTPLSTINWYVEMLLSGDAGELKPEQKDYLEEVQKGNKRMVDLVTALLNVSRLELGTFMIEPEKSDITEIADIAVKELKFKIKEKGIKFSKKYDNKLKDLMLDKKLILIVFQNLLSNAVKYTKNKGKVNLSITKKTKFVEIKVSDNGLGIPKKEQNKLFTKIFRASNVKKTSTEGTGLGLYIIKSILEQSGGSISFVSNENKGTTFTVKIPLTGMKAKKGTKKLS